MRLAIPDRAGVGTISFLGPAGTFTEEALFTQPDYAIADAPPRRDALRGPRGRRQRSATLAFVPIENSIEGAVNATVDSLVFDVDLLIQREVVLDVHIHLAAPPGTELGSITPGAVDPACHRPSAGATWPTSSPNAEIVATNSTAEAARIVGNEPRPGTAALAPRLAAELYGLEILADSVEDHPDNQTRFVALAPTGLPAPTGHDKTSIVCFQREDRPGSLHGILSEFAARSINLTKLESRPTKRGLGDYCFLIDLEGHVADEVVADCLRVLHAELRGGEVPGLVPRRRRPWPGRARPGRHGMARGRRHGSTRCDPRSARSERRYPARLGGMAERTNARLLKSLGPKGSWVRIPLPPLPRRWRGAPIPALTHLREAPVALQVGSNPLRA